MRRSPDLRALLIPLVLLLAAVQCGAQTARPVITKIDPPNWFTGLPDSLLLVHGEHFEGTTFTLRGTHARIAAATVSANGHWAFLTLATGTARPGTLAVIARNRFGKTFAPYTLTARRGRADQPRGFTSADVMYLIMPDRFADADVANDTLPGFREPDDRTRSRAYHGGDLRGIQQHLDYLQQLGVTTIWTTPLYDNSASQSGQTYHGYSASDMYGVDPHLGTLADYQALSRAAHERGMKIVLDTVPNHVGPGHPWAEDPPAPDWLHGSVSHHIPAGFDFSSIVKPEGDPARRNPVLNGWFANVLPDMNQDNPLVAQYLTQNAIWWIEMAGLDGLRIDTFPFVPRSFWHSYDGTLHDLYPHLSEVGEALDPDPKVTSFFAGGRANTGSDGTFDTLLYTPFDYPMYFALRGALTHAKPMSAIADVLRADSLYPHPERLVTFIGNHDQKRFLNEPGASVAALRLGYGLLATLRGMPQLYYGDEIGMTGGDDPDNRKDFPGGFPGDPANAFEASARSADRETIHAWVAKLMTLRARTPALQTGEQRTLAADRDTLAFVRTADSTHDCTAVPGIPRFVVLANDATEARDLIVDLRATPLAGCARFSTQLGDDVRARVSDDHLRVHLAGQQIGIFRAEP